MPHASPKIALAMEQLGTSGDRPTGLMRYGSAPGSLLSSISDSVMDGGDGNFSAGEAVAGAFFSGDSSDLYDPMGYPPMDYEGSHLIRHSSSPAGFFAVDSVLSPKGPGNFSQIGVNGTRMKRQRLSTQWSFSQQDSLSQISEISVADMGKKVSNAYMSGNIVNAPLNKRGKDNNGDIMTNFNNLESMLSLPCTSMEMKAVEKYLNMQQDHVHCERRAKRGCAMHPRSIAERERRTRISKRLKRLQDLVPNMDKQTNTSDMLDLALDYIKELQTKVQMLV